MIRKTSRIVRVLALCLGAALGGLAAGCSTTPVFETTSSTQPCQDGAPLICATAFATRLGNAASAVPPTCRCSTLMPAN